MTQLRTMKRAGVLLVLMMALVLVLGTLDASDAEARKKKRINVVTCKTTDILCIGTDRRDRLVGTEGFDQILGKEGNDIYDGRGGCDHLIDWSITSSDRYLAKPNSSGAAWIFDGGGVTDIVDFRPLNSYQVRQTLGNWDGDEHLDLVVNTTNFPPPPQYSSGGDPSLITPCYRYVVIWDFGPNGPGQVEYLRFADQDITPSQIGNGNSTATGDLSAGDEQRLARAQDEAKENSSEG